MVQFAGFIGPSYSGRSVSASAQRLINLFPEIDESGGGKGRIIYHGTPGSILFCDLGTGLPVRAEYSLNGLAFAISGTGFYEIFSNGTFVSRGTVSGLGIAQIVGNGTQMLVLSGGFIYVYNTSTHAFTAVDPGFTVQSISFMDLYFIASEANSQKIWISSILDGLTWNALDFASKEGYPDNLQGVFADHRELWLFGQETTEPWRDIGNPDFPFERIPGAHIEQGLVSIETVQKLDNTIFWVHKDARGQGSVWRGQGYSPLRVSNHAVEYWLGTSTDLSAAKSYSYVQEGHSFYVLYVPDLETTWAYDVAVNMWHERSYFDAGSHTPHLAQCHCQAFGKHLAGSREDGKIYQLDLDTYTDNTAAIRRERVSPHVHNETKWIFYPEFILDMEVGVGLISGQGSDPQMCLQYSDDGGKTWSNEHWEPMGAQGKYKQRVHWHRLGRSRNRAFRVFTTEPVKQTWIDAHLDIELGTS